MKGFDLLFIFLSFGLVVFPLGVKLFINNIGVNIELLYAHLPMYHEICFHIHLYTECLPFSIHKQLIHFPTIDNLRIMKPTIFKSKLQVSSQIYFINSVTKI